MAIFYNLWVTVDVRHNYYSNGLSGDFSFKPSAETQKFLDGHRMLFYPTDYGFKILQEGTNASTPVLSVSGSTNLTFSMYAKSPAILNMTDFSVNPSTHYPLYSNSISSPSNTADANSFYPFTASQAAVAGKADPTSFGEVSITADANTARKFKVDLSSIAPIWKYLVVSNNAAVSVADTGSNGMSFNTAIVTTMDADRRSAILASKPSGYEVYEITSTAGKAYAQAPAAGLALTKDSVVVISDLPNPQPLQGGAEFDSPNYIHEVVVTV